MTELSFVGKPSIQPVFAITVIEQTLHSGYKGKVVKKCWCYSLGYWILPHVAPSSMKLQALSGNSILQICSPEEGKRHIHN